MDLSKIQGESVGDIEQLFFGDLKQQPQNISTENNKVSMEEISKKAKEIETTKSSAKTIEKGKTVIQINNNLQQQETDFVQYELTKDEEERLFVYSPRGKKFIDITNGDEVEIVEKTEMYNGMHLYTVKREGKLITYPRNMFIGNNKIFVPKNYYISEAEKALLNTIKKYKHNIESIISEPVNLIETNDKKYLELLLDVPLEIVEDFKIPDKVPIKIYELFDLQYKILMLDSVICLDNKIASLLFVEYWF